MTNLIVNIFNKIMSDANRAVNYESEVYALRFKENAKLYELYNDYKRSVNEAPLILKDAPLNVNDHQRINSFEKQLYEHLGGENVNAFQHAYGIGIDATIHGVDGAREAGIFKESLTESKNADLNNLKDSYKDLHNNEVGLKEYKKCNNDLNQTAQNLFNDIFINSKTNKIEYQTKMTADKKRISVPKYNPNSNAIINNDDPRVPNNRNNKAEFNDYLLRGYLSNGLTLDLGFNGSLINTLIDLSPNPILGALMGIIATLFGQGTKQIDPLVLDLDGDGVETTNLTNSTVHFDLDQNTIPEKTAWLSGDDGFLVIDKNNNGSVELFGNSDTIGFESLKEYDSNNDNVIKIININNNIKFDKRVKKCA